MTGLPNTPELQLVARRTMWFERPEAALADTVRFVAYVLTYGTHADVKVLRKHLDDTALRLALDRAPAGIFDARSWGYWNLRLGRYPAPPIPTRRL